MLSISFSLLFSLPSFWSLSTNQKTMKYRFVHGIMENQCVCRVLCIHFSIFYANYVISFKIFMLSNFKHEFCMSHIILWQRRWPQQQQHRRHRRRRRQNKTSSNYLAQIEIPEKKCVCVECVFFFGQSLLKSI